MAWNGMEKRSQQIFNCYWADLYFNELTFDTTEIRVIAFAICLFLTELCEGYTYIIYRYDKRDLEKLNGGKDQS